VPLTIKYGAARPDTGVAWRLDVSSVGNRCVIDCAAASVLSVQTENADIAISSAVLKVRVTNDPGLNKWQDHPANVNITAAGMSKTYDVSPYSAACVEVTTAEAGKYIEVFMCAKG
jgi:hypothetical protein